jgi:hypothetical protein
MLRNVLKSLILTPTQYSKFWKFVRKYCWIEVVNWDSKTNRCIVEKKLIIQVDRIRGTCEDLIDGRIKLEIFVLTKTRTLAVKRAFKKNKGEWQEIDVLNHENNPYNDSTDLPEKREQRFISFSVPLEHYEWLDQFIKK